MPLNSNIKYLETAEKAYFSWLVKHPQIAIILQITKLCSPKLKVIKSGTSFSK